MTTLHEALLKGAQSLAEADIQGGAWSPGYYWGKCWVWIAHIYWHIPNKS
ncbi:hypothetical protein KDK_34750 [Dictyobacter kobayashii]|uniref:Uncharacterized protein n=1 Tax=Dictyobacter kobayashii TaxID=2014872 RepID=A0A402AKW9_9CHLR|nr:hypothetical protein KDK_34750 [Dictyobacter kobayashii]